MDSPSTYQQINGPFWTLAIEWQYYMLLPLFVLGFSLFVKRGTTSQQRLWRIITCLAGMIVWGISTRYIGNYFTALHTNDTFLVPRPALNVFMLITYGSSGKYFEDFAIGMLCSTIYIYTRNAAPEHTLTQFISKHSMRFWGTGILMLLFMACWKIFYHELFFLDPFLGNHMPFTELAYASGYGLCIIGVLFGPVGLNMMLSWGPLRWLGSLSYGLYIWHLPFLHLVDDYIVKRYSTNFISTYALYWGCVLLIIIPLAYLLYRFYERPCMKLAHKRT
jgi:peptidoglycan/LPS O-acetylase OafA/YrhL